MNTVQKSNITYWIAVLLLALLGALNAFLPQGDFPGMTADQSLAPPKAIIALVTAFSMLFIYGGLGYLGLVLARKVGFADLWDRQVSNKARFFTPAVIGAGIGVLFVFLDLIFSPFNGFGRLPHPPFPTSLVASVVAGIGEEIIFRLFFVSLCVWLLACLLLKNCRSQWVFWTAASLSGLVFAMGHLPTFMFLMGLTKISQIPPLLLAEIILLNGALSIFTAYGLRKSGYLAAVSIHLWADIVWHVLWGLF